jgi:hypothetical protein
VVLGSDCSGFELLGNGLFEDLKIAPKSIVNFLVKNGLGFIVLLFWQCRKLTAQNYLPKRLLPHSLKTQEILAKKWLRLRSVTGVVIAGFLSVFKFTGSTALRLGGLARCIERTFSDGMSILFRKEKCISPIFAHSIGLTFLSIGIIL